MSAKTITTGSDELRDAVNDHASRIDGLAAGTGQTAGSITTAALATKAVTGPKLDEAALRFLTFTGHNGAGACTLTGVKVGDKVVGIYDATDGTNGAANFEATITVNDQIQQSSATDLSAKKHVVLLVAKS